MRKISLLLMSMTMIVALVGAGLVPASAEPRDPGEAAGFAEALRSARLARQDPSSVPAAPQHRHVRTPSTVGVEPYIARTIERNARGD